MSKSFARIIFSTVAALTVAVAATLCRAQFGIEALAPDLVVHSVSAPATASQAALISTSDVTTNIGTASATASVSGVYMTTNLNEVTASWWLGNHNVAPIAKGRSTTWSGNVTVPASQPLGTNYYVVVANINRQVTELNYNNNTNYVIIVITP